MAGRARRAGLSLPIAVRHRPYDHEGPRSVATAGGNRSAGLSTGVVMAYRYSPVPLVTRSAATAWMSRSRKIR